MVARTSAWSVSLTGRNSLRKMTICTILMSSTTLSPSSTICHAAQKPMSQLEVSTAVPTNSPIGTERRSWG